MKWHKRDARDLELDRPTVVCQNMVSEDNKRQVFSELEDLPVTERAAIILPLLSLFAVHGMADSNLHWMPVALDIYIRITTRHQVLDAELLRNFSK